MVAASVIGNNLPDLDFVYTGIGGRRLGYLLHHRGYTHTLIAVLPLAAVCLAIIFLVFRSKRWAFTGGDWRWVAALCVLGPVAHLAMDYANNYGVHPWWPFDPSWHYGDCLFIAEPLLWVVLIVPLSAVVRTPAVRFGLWTCLAMMLLAVILVPAVSFGSTVVVVLGTALLAVALRRSTHSRAVATALGLSIAVIATFATSSSIMRRRLRAALASDGTRLVDLALTPAPANPLCFDVVAVERHGDQVVFRSLRASAWSGLVPPERCPDLRGKGTFAMHDEPSPARFAASARRGSIPVSVLAAEERSDCRFAAFARWSRMPFVTTLGSERIAGDLRFDREPGLGFAEIPLDGSEGRCPSFVPNWRPPIANLLDGR